MRRALATVILLFAACTGGEQEDEITVFAATSLTEAFETLDTDATFSFGASSRLAAQVIEGAPADVLVTADEQTMQRVVDAGLVDGHPVEVATNRLTIAVPRGNPAAVRSSADLARPGLRVVLAAPAVPAGRYAAEALAEAGVEVRPVSLEPDVKAVAAKVAIGEVDAGIVYVTDVRADPRLDAVPLDTTVVARYQAAVLRGADSPAPRRFVTSLLTVEARRVLVTAGFGPPR